MADSSIIKYICDQISAGYTEDQIRAVLSQQGWESGEIDEAMAAAQSPPPQTPVQKPAPAQTKQPAKPVLEKPADSVKDKVARLEQRQTTKPGFGIHVILSMAGGFIILINSVLIFLGMGDMLSMIAPGLDITLLTVIGITLASFEMFMINLVVAIGIILCSFLSVLKPGQSMLSGIVIISLGVMSLLSGNGFMIGALIAIIGGALILTE